MRLYKSHKPNNRQADEPSGWQAKQQSLSNFTDKLHKERVESILIHHYKGRDIDAHLTEVYVPFSIYHGVGQNDSSSNIYFFFA